VWCQLDKLRRCLPQRIRRALDELPGTLDETYERTLDGIDEEKREFAHRLFQCVTVACRPLHVEELAEFLAFDFDAEGGPRFEEDWRPEDAASAVLSTCSSMISIVNMDDSRVVQFSHFSVMEFLTSTRIANGLFSRYYFPLELSHLIVAQGCLSILLQLNDEVTKSSIKKFPLADYAARHWVEHAKFGNVTSHIQDSMKQLFNPGNPHFAAWTWIFNMDGYEQQESMMSEMPSPPEAGPLYYSALCGFDEVAEWLVTTCSQDVNAQGGSCETPLVAASSGGFLKIAQILLEHGANVNNKDFFPFTALHRASIRGHLGVSRLLLDCGADIHTKDFFGRTSLHFASRAGHVEVVQLLLESNADPNISDWSGDTPFIIALERGHPGLVQLLLQHGADPNAQNQSGESLLHVASRHGHLGVVEQLLELGANVHVRDNQSRTPFQAASQPEYTWPKPGVKPWGTTYEIEQLLLKYGAERL
jgi:Ankyrin repeats (3 copies)